MSIECNSVPKNQVLGQLEKWLAKTDFERFVITNAGKNVMGVYGHRPEWGEYDKTELEAQRNVDAKEVMAFFKQWFSKTPNDNFEVTVGDTVSFSMMVIDQKEVEAWQKAQTQLAQELEEQHKQTQETRQRRLSEKKEIPANLSGNPYVESVKSNGRIIFKWNKLHADFRELGGSAEAIAKKMGTHVATVQRQIRIRGLKM